MTKYLCRIISRFTLIINDKVLMYLWITVMHKKVSHPNEIQNTNVSSYEGTEGTKVQYLRRYEALRNVRRCEPSFVRRYLRRYLRTFVIFYEGSTSD